ncbi:MAG: hypothetical protein H7844_05480 [Nitrospirae bacterium YQR-1]
MGIKLNDLKMLWYKIIFFTVSTLILVLMISVVTIFLVPFKYEDDYIYAFIDKIKILERIPSPKLIVVGGSDIALGVDCGKIEKILNIPSVNFGLYGGVSIKFILRFIKPYLKENDIVLIMPAYLTFSDNLYEGEGGLASLLVEIYPQGFKYLDFRQFVYLLKYFPKVITEKNYFYLKYLISRLTNQPYGILEGNFVRSGFNQNGDFIWHLNRQPKTFTPSKWNTKNTSFELTDFLNRYADELKTKGVKIYFSFPPVDIEDYNLNKGFINLVELNIRKKLNFDILNKPEDTHFDMLEMYDSPYHLNAKGRERFAVKIINGLKTYAGDGRR